MKGEGAWKDIFSDLYTRGLWEFRHPPEIFFFLKKFLRIYHILKNEFLSFSFQVVLTNKT